MNRKILYIVSVTLVLFSGCLKEQEDLFSEPAAIRLNNAIGSIDSVLTHAKNGWVMQYFADSSSAGYTMLLRFEPNGKVTVAAKNMLVGGQYAESVSMFDVIGDNGPVITFNTYNEILHRFSDPSNPAGIGLGGDYEFVVYSYADTLIRSKGKKTGTEILLMPLNEQENWNDYLDSIIGMKKILFSAGSPDLRLVVDGVKTDYLFTNGSSMMFTVGKLQTDLTYDCPFILTHSGFRLYNAEPFSKKGAKNFVLNGDKSALVSAEDPTVKLLGPDDLALYISETSVNWVLDESLMSEDVKILCTQIIQSVESKYNGVSDVYLAVRKLDKEGVFSLLLGFTYNRKIIEAELYFDYSLIDKNVLGLSIRGDGNSAGIALSKSISGYMDFATLLSSSFQLSTDVLVCPKNITFTKQNNSGTWFVSTRE